MENCNHSVDLGTILCKHCGTVIDTLNTKRVQNFYVDCKQPACENNRTLTNEQEYTASN